MQPSNPKENNQPDQLYKWVPIEEFTLPPTTIQASFKNRIKLLLSKVKGVPADASVSMVDTDKLQALSQDLMASVVPAAPWEDHAGNLDAVLHPWMDAPQNTGGGDHQYSSYGRCGAAEPF